MHDISPQEDWYVTCPTVREPVKVISQGESSQEKGWLQWTLEKIIPKWNKPNSESTHFCNPPCSIPEQKFLFAAMELFVQLAFTSQVSSSFLYSSAKVRIEIQAVPVIGYEKLLHSVSCVRIIQALSLIPFAWVYIVGPRSHCYCQKSIAIHMLPLEPQVSPNNWPPQSFTTRCKKNPGLNKVLYLLLGWILHLLISCKVWDQIVVANPYQVHR